VITADCDIVQKKAGDRYSLLRVVAGHEWLQTRWAEEQLRRLTDKQARIAADALSTHIQRRDDGLDPLDPDALLRWLAEAEPAQVWAAAVADRGEDARVIKAMHAVKLAGDRSGRSALDRLRQAWTALGRSPKEQAAAMHEAFSGERGFPDFFMLPDMPDTDGYGFVVLLRDLFSVNGDALFATERDARLADRPDAFHRFARLQDGVRFAVTQKLAFLFSRIGLSSSYERACASAADLLIQQIGEQENMA
jgi:hypothetical protein